MEREAFKKSSLDSNNLFKKTAVSAGFISGVITESIEVIGLDLMRPEFPEEITTGMHKLSLSCIAVEKCRCSVDPLLYTFFASVLLGFTDDIQKSQIVILSQQRESVANS